MKYYNYLLTLEQVADRLQLDIERVRQLVLAEELYSSDYEHILEKDLKDYMKREGLHYE